MDQGSERREAPKSGRFNGLVIFKITLLPQERTKSNPVELTKIIARKVGEVKHTRMLRDRNL